jgi:hypothetical protein
MRRQSWGVLGVAALRSGGDAWLGLMVGFSGLFWLLFDSFLGWLLVLVASFFSLS